VPGVKASLGKLLEDAVATYFKQFFYNKPSSFITFDAAKGGADFIIGLANRRIIVEVGWGTKSKKQILSTMQRIKANYGIIIAQNRFSVDTKNNILFLPIKDFLLGG